jgi:hypothetical protein
VRSGQLVAVAVALTWVPPVLARWCGFGPFDPKRIMVVCLSGNADERINPRYEQSRRLSDTAQTNGENFAGLKNFSHATHNSALGKYRLHTLRRLSCASYEPGPSYTSKIRKIRKA